MGVLLKLVIKSFIVVLLLTILFYPLLSYVNTYKTNSFWINISGDIKLDPKAMERYDNGEKFNIDRPKDIRIYHNIDTYKNSYFESRIFAISNITWKNNFNGHYQQTLEIPRTMDLIVYAQQDLSKVIKVDYSKLNYDVDLFWTGYSEKQLDKPTFSHYYEWTTRFRPEIRNNLISANFKNETQKKLVEEDLIAADREIGESGFKESNETLLHLIYANWFLQRADYRIHYFRLKNCVDENEKLVNSHNHIFYNNPYEITRLINSSYTYLEDSRGGILGSDWINNFRDVERANSENWYFFDRKRFIEQLADNCEANLEEVKNVYYYQEVLLKKRMIYLLLFFVVSFSLGWLVSRLNELSRNFQSFFDNLSTVMEQWANQIDLRRNKAFYATIIVGIFVANATLLASNINLPQKSVFAMLSSIFGFISLIFLIINSTNVRNINQRNQTGMWFLVTLFLSIVFYPFVMFILINFISLFIGFFREIYVFFKNYLIGKW